MSQIYRCVLVFLHPDKGIGLTWSEYTNFESITGAVVAAQLAAKEALVEQPSLATKYTHVLIYVIDSETGKSYVERLGSIEPPLPPIARVNWK